MALQINIDAEAFGVEVPAAYVRIVGVNYSATNNTVAIFVNIYATAQAREEGKNPLETTSFGGHPGVDMPSLDGTIAGLRAAIYSWLKTLPKFATAIDV